MLTIDRRMLLAGAPLAAGMALAGKARAQSNATAAAPPSSPTPEPVAQRLAKRAQANLHAIAFDGSGFSGLGWDMLVAEGRSSDFFLIGEEHGLAEIPVLAGEIFQALRPAGYSKLAIELSAPIADDLDRAARGGMTGLRAYLAKYPPGPAFFAWRPEAELLAKVRALVPPRQRAIWGLDYEVLGERALIDKLRKKAPASAFPPLDALDKASRDAWARWKSESNPEHLPMFSLKPAVVHAVRDAWPSPDRESAIILDILAATLEINLAQQTSGWRSNKLRADLNRNTLIRLLSEDPGAKVVFKMGSTHTMRGVSWTGQFDIGSLAPEAAALRGGKSFHLLVGGGANSRQGMLDPVTMGLKTGPVDMLRQEFGMDFLLDVMPKTGLGLLDLRPLRSIVNYTPRLKEFNNPEAVRVIHGYDALLVWNGATPTSLTLG